MHALNNLSGLPGYKLNEYVLVITPHEDLRERIKTIRKEFAEKFENDSALYAKSHVSMVTFRQSVLMEDRLINRLRGVASGLAPVKIELNAFGSFPAHTIYINVVSKIPFQSIVKKVRTETQKLMKLDDDHKPHFLLEPYITIGRKLLPWQYEKAWTEYSNLNFTARFMADSMTLLKRPVGEMRYSIVERLDFKNQAVTETQGDLFS